jgi:tetratricopeptide (TPR) repeat protein
MDLKKLVVIALLLGGGAATAQNKPTGKAAARELYREGKRQYDLNEFAKALELFKRGYEVYEEPALLYNIAQCYRQLGNDEQAIAFYRSYLRQMDSVPNREEVQRVIASLEQSVSARREQKERERREQLAQKRAEAEMAERKAKAANLEVEALALKKELAAKPPAPPKPIYKQWWLWTVVGGVVVGAVAAGLAVALYPAPRFNPTLGSFSSGLILQARF